MQTLILHNAVSWHPWYYRHKQILTNFQEKRTENWSDWNIKPLGSRKFVYIPLALGMLKLQYLNQQKSSTHLSALPLEVIHPSMSLIFATTLWWKGAGYRFRWKLTGEEKTPTKEFYIFLNPFCSAVAKSSSATQQKMENRSRDLVCCCSPQTADWAASVIICRTQTLIDDLTQCKQQKQLTEAFNNYLLISNKLFVTFLGPNIFNSFYIQRHCMWRLFE